MQKYTCDICGKDISSSCDDENPRYIVRFNNDSTSEVVSPFAIFHLCKDCMNALTKLLGRRKSEK